MDDDNLNTMECMERLDRRLHLSERALLEARQRRADLEHFLSETIREATSEEERVDRARELLTSLEHRQDVQRRELQHWEQLATDAHQVASEANDELTELLNAARNQRVQLNNSATDFVDRLSASLPWSVSGPEHSKQLEQRVLISPEEATEFETRSLEELDAAVDGLAETVSRVTESVGRLTDSFIIPMRLEHEL